MSIIDSIKNAFVSQFSGPVTMGMIAASLATAFVLALFILVIYRKTFSGIVYNRTIALTIVLLAMVTAMIIRTINSNLSLSLGMVGALSIVRFRTAIKEPVDTAFMFWAITAGIMSGAGLYIIAIVGSLVLGILFYVAYVTSVRAAGQYLLVVIYNRAVEASVKSVLDSVKKKKLKSKSSSSNGNNEITFEVIYSKEIDAVMAKLQGIEGVKNVNLVTYTNEFGM